MGPPPRKAGGAGGFSAGCKGQEGQAHRAGGEHRGTAKPGGGQWRRA